MSEWISVKDDTPDWDGVKDYEHVRVFAPGFSLYDCHVDGWLFHQVDALYDGAGFYLNGEKIPGVTHWMYIPKPPEVRHG